MKLIEKMGEMITNRDKNQTDFYYECHENDPVGLDAIEDTVTLVKVAHKIHCDFTLTFILKIGEFSVDAASLKDIKILKKTKNESDRIVISYNNALISYDTTIKVDDIVFIDLYLKYKTIEDGDADV